MTYTEAGEALAAKIQDAGCYEVDIIKRDDLKKRGRKFFGQIFEAYEGIIFICAAGIAVRVMAPYLKDKTIDPAVVVVDDMGRYAISLLSGHIGGANRLAADIAEIIAAQPIITTASDGRGIEAVDLFAQRHHLVIESMEDAKVLTAMMIAGKRIRLIPPTPYHIRYHNLVEKDAEGIIYITPYTLPPLPPAPHLCPNAPRTPPHPPLPTPPQLPTCLLRPRQFNVGIGCRRGKSKQEVLEAVRRVFNKNNLSIRAIKEMGTIDVKKDEKGILEACTALNCKLKIFDRAAIRKVQHQFEGSNFVLDNVGVTSVAEPCAHLLGGEIIVRKTAVNGVTIAVSKEEFCG